MIGLIYIVLCEARLDSMLMISLGEFGGMHAPSKNFRNRVFTNQVTIPLCSIILFKNKFNTVKLIVQPKLHPLGQFLYVPGFTCAYGCIFTLSIYIVHIYTLKITDDHKGALQNLLYDLISLTACIPYDVFNLSHLSISSCTFGIITTIIGIASYVSQLLDSILAKLLRFVFFI